MNSAQVNPMANLLVILAKLDAARISYDLDHQRDSIMVRVPIPGQWWEVEFFADGQVEVERFISTGAIEGEECLQAFFDAYTN